jgi:hypothetical protein
MPRNSQDGPKGRISPVDEAVMLRHAACDWRMSRGDIAVYAVLLEHSNEHFTSYPGPQRIATKAHLTITNVRKALGRLETFEYIEILRRNRTGDAHRGESFNRYELCEMPVYPPKQTKQCNFGKNRTPLAGNASSISRNDRTQLAGDLEPRLPANRTQLAGDLEPRLPARDEVAFESTLEIASEITGASRRFSSLGNQQQQQQSHQRQERLQEEEQEAKNQERLREYARGQYELVKNSGSFLKRLLETRYKHFIFDLIEAKPRRSYRALRPMRPRHKPLRSPFEGRRKHA